MSDRGSATTSGGTGLVAAGAVILLLLAAAVYLSLREEGQISETDVAALLSPSGEPVVRRAPPADPGPADPGRTEEEAAPAQVTQNDAPSIDEVRVDGSGMMVVAGRASPGSRVEVVVDGEVVSSAEADSSGAFAALGQIAASDAARSLTLRSDAGAGVSRSDEEIILAPVADALPETIGDISAPPGDRATAAPEPEVTSTGRTPTPVLPAQSENTRRAKGDGTSQTVNVEGTADNDVTVPAAPVAATSQLEPVANPAPSGQLAPALAEVEALPQPETSQEPVAQTPSPSQTGRIAVLRSDAGGVGLVQTAPADRVVLDTIGYSQEGVVQLSGRASSDAVEIRAYLDNRAVAQMPVGPDGNWRGDVPDVQSGVYTLRIDAMGETGAVTSRLETPFKRESPAVIAAATQGSLRSITVQTGDTLWAIARDRYGEGVLYVQVFEANRAAIRDPDLIYPGQVFDLPSD